MTPHKQLNRHRPEQGVSGDCARTCIACLLDLEPAEVPHFADFKDDGTLPDGEEYYAAKKAWLAQRGLTVGTTIFPGLTPLRDVLATWGHLNPGAHAMLAGTSKNDVNHVVIICDGAIAHDPSLDDAGIVGPCDDGYYWIDFLMPLQVMK